MIRIFKTLIPLFLIFSFNIEASKLLDALKTMPADQSQEFSSVDEYMQNRFKTLEQFGMPEKEIQSMKDSASSKNAYQLAVNREESVLFDDTDRDQEDEKITHVARPKNDFKS